MNDINQILSRTHERLRAEWSLVTPFLVAPAGVAGEILVGIRDFGVQYKKFEYTLWDECLKLRSLIGSRIGINQMRRDIAPRITEYLLRARSERSPTLFKNKKVAACVVRLEEFLFLYEIALEKSRLGEAIISCYPRCGIPCGWYENEGVLYLYQPELKD